MAAFGLVNPTSVKFLFFICLVGSLLRSSVGSIARLICLSQPDCVLRLSAVSLSLWSLFGQSGHNTMWTHAWACRVFVAQREGFNNTWINTYTPFVDLYAADDTECTSQEVRLCSQLLTHIALPPMSCITWDQSMPFFLYSQCP